MEAGKRALWHEERHSFYRRAARNRSLCTILHEIQPEGPVALQICDQQCSSRILRTKSAAGHHGVGIQNRLVLLQISHEDQDLEHHLLKMTEQIRSWIEAHLDFTVTFGVGTVAEDVALIRRSYQEAGQAVNRKVTLGINQIIGTVEGNEKISDEWFTYLQLIQSVVRQVRLADQGGPMLSASYFMKYAFSSCKEEILKGFCNILSFKQSVSWKVRRQK